MSNEEKEFLYEKCGEIYSQEDHLQRHLLLQNGQKETGCTENPQSTSNETFSHGPLAHYTQALWQIPRQEPYIPLINGIIHSIMILDVTCQTQYNLQPYWDMLSMVVATVCGWVGLPVLTFS